MLSLILIWAIALPIGIYSAVRRYSIGDHLFTLLGFIGLAIPTFIMALVLMYVSYRFLGQNVGGLFSDRVSGRAVELGQSSGIFACISGFPSSSSPPTARRR